MSGPSLAVVLCSHNPRAEHIRRALEGLEAQTLPRDRWELLLVDNASTESLRERFALDWHPGARHVRAPILGLTNARLRGLEETSLSSSVIVFVDDDNVLAPDYLEVCAAIGRDRPEIGA